MARKGSIRKIRVSRRGIALIVCMFFVAILTAFAVGMIGMADSNVQLADNQHNANQAFAAAQSGLECGKYLVTRANTNAGYQSTSDNIVTLTQADDTWTKFCVYAHNNPPAGKTVSATPTNFTDSHGSGKQLVIPGINIGTSANASNDPAFVLRLYRYNSDANTIKIESTGTHDGAQKRITVSMKIQKSADLLKYAIASKTRVWITGNSTIHGNMYSSWKYQNLSPFNMTSDSKVLGSINTILTNIRPGTQNPGPDLFAGTSTTAMPYDLETLDSSGNPRYDSHGNKIYSSSDEIQGQYDCINYNINYGEKATNMPGMDLADYDTSIYKNQTTTIADSTYDSTTTTSHGHTTTTMKTVTEYFPHNSDDYTHGPSGSLQLTRYVCTGKTLTNAKVAAGKNTLFKNCTFDGILYVDNSTAANNVRFENCVFNGPIVTTPSTDTSSGWWQRNQLYFTGAETFQNNTTVPATILAPNFNVNLGNTDPTRSENNILTGAIVGGIVDIRGNAQVYGTIISMFDTSGYSSGYVSNIGATLNDGGSETVSLGDVGTIDITPDPSKLLPSGITAPIIISPQQSSYSEI
jgi:Tfp pilus assembly protein PilX